MKIISNDNGRSFNKSFCGGRNNVFQSTMAPAENGFNLTVETKPSDLWIEYLKKNDILGVGENWLLGDLAIRQRPKKLIQDRDTDKCNRQNIIQTITACSLYAKNEEVILLTNVPARDYSKQKEKIEDTLKGSYKITHRAGDLTDTVSEFIITQCYAFPEGESAYYGAAYDLNMNLVNKEILQYPTLILDIGDETTNYISMNPGGEPQDDASGSLPSGLHNVYAELLAWLSKQGVVISIPELTRKVIWSEPIFTGNKQIFYLPELYKRYSEFEFSVYSDLNSLLSLKRYRNIIFCGGSITPLRTLLEKRYSFLTTYFTAGSQLLNCYGQYIIYRLSRG